MITCMGLILREYQCGENSKSLSVLTAEYGVIDVLCRGGYKPNSKNTGGTQLFSYSKVCLDVKKDANNQTKYYLNSSEAVNIFYKIRLDAKKTALACYFSEMLCYCRIEDSSCSEILRLILNTLFFLDKGSHDCELLRCIFELRLLCEMGFRPNLVGCCHCYTYEAEIMHINLRSGIVECDKCCENKESMYDVQFIKSDFYILRYIMLTDYDRLFSFRISQAAQKRLTDFSEQFVTYHLQTSFKTLNFYKCL